MDEIAQAKATCIANLEQARTVSAAGDEEHGHTQADEALTRFLDALGYGDVVAKFEAVRKWYA